MSTYEISKSSLLSLKAEILRKQEELSKARADNEIKRKIIKKNTPLEIKNKGVEARQNNDITEEDEDLLKRSKSVLEAKAKLYEKLSAGEIAKEDAERNKRFLVRFDKKNKSYAQNASPIDFEDSESDKYPESDDERYQSDEEGKNKDPEEQWVDYTDCLGRTRKCLQKDLAYLMSKDEELKKTVEAKHTNIDKDDDSKEHTENKDDSLNENSLKEQDNKIEPAQESELLSSDMRRELLRQQWEKEEDELRNKSNIHYQDILFGEARTHGVGYYGFSKDEDERLKQQEALRNLRNETEMKQKRAQELKTLREKQLAARIKAAKDRKRARLGLPPEEEKEDTASVAPQLEVSEEEKKKQEELEAKQKENERLLERARQKHVRPWDIGKEGVKQHYEMTQKEWVEKKREERVEEFAPPQLYSKRSFRGNIKESNLEDADKSLKFTTKKSDSSRHKRKKFQEKGPRTYNGSDDDVSTVPSKVDLNEEVDFSDRLLSDYNTSRYNENNYCEESVNESSTSRGRGVEIAPPSTFDYYGPSSSKNPKNTKPAVNIQNSIEEGLKFLRKQVEEKQKSNRREDDMFLF